MIDDTNNADFICFIKTRLSSDQTIPNIEGYNSHYSFTKNLNHIVGPRNIRVFPYVGVRAI